MPKFVTPLRLIVSGALVLGIILLASGQLDLVLFTWVHTLDDVSKLSIVSALLLCATSSWHVTRKVYKARLNAQAETFSTRLMEETSFRDAAIEQHCIVSVTDSDGRYLRVNQKFLSVFGFREQDVVGQHSRLLYFDTLDDGPDDWVREGHECFRIMTEHLQDGKPWSGEQVLRTADGRPVFMSTTVIPKFDDRGQHLYNVCLRTDVTNHRLTETQRQLCQVLDDLQDEVFIYEVDTLRIRYMNKAALLRFGWTLETAVTKTIPDTTPAFNVGQFRTHTAPLFAGQRQVVAIQAQHGESDIEISTRIHRDGSGQRQFLSVLRDISGRKKIEKAKMESMAQVSHELRTPLTSILGSLRLVLSGKMGEVPPKVEHLIDIANRNSEHLQMMVNDILDLERMNSGKLSLTAEQEDMRDIVRDTCRLNSPLVQEKGLNITVTTEDDALFVTCDRKRISQVITNLLSNAAKYSPDKGTIEVAVSPHKNCVRVSVSDHGPGIPEAEQKKLFKNFSRVASGDGKTRSGTGLGLAICKKIVGLHHGKIHLESTVNQGTTVFFDIPRLTVEPECSLSNLVPDDRPGKSNDAGKPNPLQLDNQQEIVACPG